MRFPVKNCSYSPSALKNIKKEADKLESKNKNFSRQTRKQSVGEQCKSGIADHALQNNHFINLPFDL